MNENCLIVQSGGPTAVSNNSVVGLINEFYNTNKKKGKVYGAKGGIKGLLTGDYVDLSKWTCSEKEKISIMPGFALGTCRHQLMYEEIQRVTELMQEAHIKYLFFIGGNGSMAVADKINKFAKENKINLQVIGIPASIDNDIIKTHHCPGYGSAAKFIATSLLDMKIDIMSYTDAPRITIIETMGRNTGWIAAASALASHSAKSAVETLIYLPEFSFNKNRCIEKIERAIKINKSIFLVIAEGIKDKNGNLLNEDNLTFDNLNRPKLGGVSFYLKEEIKRTTNFDAKVILPGTLQRSSIRHLAKTDVNEAYEIGKIAWQKAYEGYSGFMMTVKERKYGLISMNEVAGRERFVPREWYDEDENLMKPEFINYVKPLIKGEINLLMENGLPAYQNLT